MLFTAMSPIFDQFILPLPAADVPVMPITTARQIIPRTSSITAAARIVVPSGESTALRSESMRAVMPTLVAVHRIPMKSTLGSSMEVLNIHIPSPAPNRYDTAAPPIPTKEPVIEYRKNCLRSVSNPETNSRMTDPKEASA